LYKLFLFSLMVVVVGALGCSPAADPKSSAIVKCRELVLNKEYDAAIEQLNKVIEMDDKSVEAYSLRASCYSGLKKNDEAVKDFSKAIELDPENRGAYLGRSSVYKAMGKLPQAKSDTLKAKKISD